MLVLWGDLVVLPFVGIIEKLCLSLEDLLPLALSMVASSVETRDLIHVTNVYAPVDLPSKTKLWAYIRHVRSYFPFLPWIVAGDFNSLINLEEKRGGLTRLGPSSKILQENIDP